MHMGQSWPCLLAGEALIAHALPLTSRNDGKPLETFKHQLAVMLVHVERLAVRPCVARTAPLVFALWAMGQPVKIWCKRCYAQ